MGHYFKNGVLRIYFDSYGQITLYEIQQYLKTPSEERQRNTDIIQPIGTKICGHLCLYVLKSLSNGLSFQDVLEQLTKEGSGIRWTNWTKLTNSTNQNDTIFQNDMFLYEIWMTFSELTW